MRSGSSPRGRDTSTPGSPPALGRSSRSSRGPRPWKPGPAGVRSFARRRSTPGRRGASPLSETVPDGGRAGAHLREKATHPARRAVPALVAAVPPAPCSLPCSPPHLWLRARLEPDSRAELSQRPPHSKDRSASPVTPRSDPATLDRRPSLGRSALVPCSRRGKDLAPASLSPPSLLEASSRHLVLSKETNRRRRPRQAPTTTRTPLSVLSLEVSLTLSGLRRQ